VAEAERRGWLLAGAVHNISRV